MRISAQDGENRSSSLDREVWDRLRWIERAGSPGFLERIVQLFLEDSTQRLARLRAGAECLDYRAVAADARALRRSAAELGATRLARLTDSLREAAEARDAERCQLLARRVEAEFEFVQHALRQA